MHGNYLHFACRILYCNCQKGSRLAIARASGRKENGMEEMTKEEMQRFLIKEAQRGSTEMEAYRNLMEILGIEFPNEKKEPIE